MKSPEKMQEADVENRSTTSPVPVADPSPEAPGEENQPEASGESTESDKEPAHENDITPQEAAPAASGEDTVPREEVRKMVEEAYLKGRNEAIDRLMKRPAMLQPLRPKARPASDEPEVMILNNPKVSIWDR